MTSDRVLFSRDPLRFTVAGSRFEIPYTPAGAWARELARVHVLAGTLAPVHAREALADLLIDVPDAAVELRAESLRLLAEAGGRKWWEVARLLRTSESPEILGRLVLAGADPWTRSLGEWCAAVYALCVKGADEKARLKFDFSLSIPPAAFEDEWDDDGDDADATLSAVNAMMGT